MDIAALSIGMNQAALAQSVSISLTKTIMETSQESANQMLEMIQAPHPNLGKSIDIKA